LHSPSLKGASLISEFGNNQLFEKDNKRFARLFLINDSENLKKWQVTASSIPQRLRTFIGRPFISEPGLAHFDTDSLPVHKILEKQEQFRAGTIVDVVQSPTDGQAYAIVEFADTSLGNKVWNEWKKGEAIYTSPAVAGYSTMQGDTRLFVDWFGLHLARVGSPAYGVMHATLKATCEGPEKDCIQKLVASASEYIKDSSQVSTCQKHNQSMTTSQPASAMFDNMTDEEKKKKMKEMEDAQASASAQIKELTDKLAKATQSASEGDGGRKSTDITDPVADPQSGKGAHDRVVQPKGTASIEDRLANAEKALANYQAKEKQGLIDQIVSMKASASLITDESAERTLLSKMSSEQLQTKVADLGPLVDKINELQGNNPYAPQDGRVVHVPAGTSSASASSDEKPKIRNLSQVRYI